MTPITNPELDLLCTTIRDTPPPFYSIQQDFVKDLYNTGCRPNELLTMALWSYGPLGPNYYQLQPLKGNFTRAILKADCTPELQGAIEGFYDPYQGLSLRQLEYSMKQINPAGPCFHETKEMVSYLFRYNRCKLLWDAGVGEDFIQEYFGWYNPVISWDYGSSVIQVTNWPI